MGTARRRFALRAMLIASAVLAAACLTACGGHTNATPTGSLLAVTERDFHISIGSTHVSAGDLVLRIHNAGPDQHELIMIPEAQSGVPFRTDGFTVDEETLQKSEPGSINPQRPGGTKYLQVHLRPGRYVLFCNMAGHFLSGMHTELVVTP